MEITVKLKNITRSPQKIRPILFHVRGKNALSALNTLKFINKAGAREISGLLTSAIAAAREHEMNESDLLVKIAKCDQAQTLKRHIYKARGRVSRISKRNSHLTITLSDEKTISKENIEKDSKRLEKQDKKKIAAKPTEDIKKA